MTSIQDVSADPEAAGKRVEEFSEPVADQAETNGPSWLKGYEKVLQNLLDLEAHARQLLTGRWFR